MDWTRVAMRLDTTFRLSFYLTLGLACACLAQAEAFFMLWFAIGCVPLAALVFVLAWRHEGEWVIHETASNYLGIGIGLAAGGWLLVQLPRSDTDLIAGGVPWPAGLLPHLGLLLLPLLAVKLFRPKQLSDFWVIQTIGLMVVTLGCVLAGDPAFTGLLFVYLASLIWCLALFQLYRGERPAGGPLFAPAVATGDAVPPVPWRRLGLGRSLRWSLSVVSVGLLLFLVMPRSSTSQWVPEKLSSSGAVILTVGIDAGMNLNRVGTVELSPNPAFHVRAVDASGKPAPLPADQLWRVDVLDYYRRGHWLNYAQYQDLVRPLAPPEASEAPPVLPGLEPNLPPPPIDAGPELARPPAGDGRLMPRQVPMQLPGELPSYGRPIQPSEPTPGPGQRYLRYRLRPMEAGGLVLAEPLDLRYVGLDPRAGNDAPVLPLFYEVTGADTALGILASIRRLPCAYTQVIEPGQGMERRPARALDPAYRDYLFSSPVPAEVVDWAQRWLAAQGQLTVAQRRLDEAGHVGADHHAVVSRALCRHLALSGAYTYTLNLRRQQPRLDPTADFLCNVKAGHCERFAGGLTLALRGLGIPARVVKGYRGAEAEQDGEYVVRLDQAHSWVQVLVRTDDGWYWLTLDPTPGAGELVNPLTTWLSWVGDLDYEQLWRRFVLNYNGDAQWTALYYAGHGLWHSPTGRRLLWQVPLGLAAALALVLAWRRRRRLARLLPRRAGTRPAPDFYRRLLNVLARRLALKPQPGQTPREFAATAGAVLAARAATAAWSAVPAAAADALYRVRFAGVPLDLAEEQALRQQLAALAAALAAR